MAEIRDRDVPTLKSAPPGIHGAQESHCYTYFLECSDGSLYCGWTGDLEQRIQVHNKGKGARYTRGRRPVRLVYYEEFSTREEAMSREWHLKRLSRREKERLIREGNPGLSAASEEPGKKEEGSL